MYYFSVLMTKRPGMIMKLLGAFYYTISSLAISTISGMSDIAQLVELPVEQRSCLCLTAFSMVARPFVKVALDHRNGYSSSKYILASPYAIKYLFFSKYSLGE